VAWLSNDVFRDETLQAMTTLLLQAPELRWVQSGAAGTDTPLLEGLIRRGIRLTTSHVTAIPIAEYVLGAVLRLYQQPERWAENARRHVWQHRNFREVHGTTWVVVGLGGIGTEVANRARAFGARVVGVRRTPSGTEPADRVISPGELPEAVPEADVIVLCAPGSPETHHLVDDGLLALVRPDAVLVNVARGSLVDEPALLRALDAGLLGHAVLDVMATEPLPSDSPLWDHPRVTVTPHASGGGTGRFGRSADVFALNLTHYLRGEPLLFEVGAGMGRA
jgi:phosphoglycerate dehydrogenase-like enzyme